MASSIDVTKPVAGSPTTASVRDNFSYAKTEIEALQTDKADLSGGTFTGTVNLTATFQIDGVAVTATAAELNKLDGVTATTTELNYLDGVTSNIQTQLNAKGTSDYGSGDFDTDFAGKSTSDLSEGTNLYYTDARANSAIDARVDKAFVEALNPDAASVDGYSIQVDSGSPSGTDANTIYLVT